MEQQRSIRYKLVAETDEGSLFDDLGQGYGYPLFSSKGETLKGISLQDVRKIAERSDNGKMIMDYFGLGD
jgi:hypothetical protein